MALPLPARPAAAGAGRAARLRLAAGAAALQAAVLQHVQALHLLAARLDQRIRQAVWVGVAAAKSKNVYRCEQGRR